MAWQLIYTSAPRGLVAGRSGFCTVARHREIRDGLVSAIERFSQYDRSGRASGALHPVVFAHRIVRLGGSSYHVLSCTRDAGADYSGRTNHLAHHLICEPGELAHAPSPADIMLQMEWRRTWTEAPRYFDEAIDLGRFTRSIELPAQEWQALTGDAGSAALPLEGKSLAGCYWLYAAIAGERSLLPLIGESLLLLDPVHRAGEKLWQVTFTTYLQSTDQTGDFVWRGCWLGSPAAAAAQGGRQLLDLTAPRSLPTVENRNADLARNGFHSSPRPDEAPKAGGAPAALDGPGPAAESGREEIDLDALLASADRAPIKKKRRKSKPPAAAEGAALEESLLLDVPPSRPLPLQLIVVAALVALLLGGSAVAFVLWRDHQVEEFRSDLTRTRNRGDFAGAQEKAARIGGLFRSQEPLRIEIERTGLAAGLDALKTGTPEDAADFLARHQARLAAAGIQGDLSIEDRLRRIGNWVKAATEVSKLRAQVAEASAAEASVLANGFAEAEQHIASLDQPYQPGVEGKLQEAGRLFVQRRVDALGKGGLRDGAAFRQLLQDAARFHAGPELLAQIAALERPRGLHAGALPKEVAPSVEPTTPAPKNAPSVEVPPNLPTVPTYVGVATPAGFDLANVKEISAGTGWPKDKDGGGWKLFRAPPIALDPAASAGENCSVAGPKLYDGRTTEFAVLNGTRLDLIAKTKAAAPAGNFLLRFTPASGEGAFQIYLVQGESASEALIRLPVRWLTYDPKRLSLAIHPAIGTAVSRIKLAAAGSASLSFQTLERPLSLPFTPATDLNVAPMIDALDADAKSKSANQKSTVKALAEKVNAALKARDRLMASAVASAGNELSDLDPQLATLTTYAGLTSGASLQDGAVVLDYSLVLLKSYAKRLEGEIDRVKSVSRDLDISKNNAEKERLSKEQNSLSEAKATVEKLAFTTGKEQLRRHSVEGVIGVWGQVKPSLAKHELPPIVSFREKWSRIFNDSTINALRPFLLWNATGTDGDLDAAAAKLAERSATTELTQSPFDLQLKNARSNFLGLGPFSIDLKGAAGSPIHVVIFERKPNDAEPEDAAK